MSVIHCPHQDASDVRRVCLHLLETLNLPLEKRLVSYRKRFTGVGTEYDIICWECERTPSEVEANLRNVCQACFKEIDEDEANWEGIIGLPQVLERTSDLYFTHETVELLEPITERILDIQPVDLLPQSVWVALTESGNLIKIDLDARSVTPLTPLPPSGLNLEDTTPSSFPVTSQKVALHLSPDGHTAAVVNTRGQYGVVVDLNTGQMTMPLERDDYHIAHSTFPVAFFELDGRLLLIHGTAWNRLDVSDPKTGELLTERTLPTYQRGNPLPGHYLDYFHCGLTVSSNHEWVADNGWVWSPVGVVSTWNLRRWVQDNVWESEDGASKKTLCWRAYYWDGPLCWINDQTLAVWGYGRDDEWLIPAVRIFDVESGKELRWFPGSVGGTKVSSSGTITMRWAVGGSLMFADYLFSFAEGYGTSVCDVVTGERLLLDPSFCPMRYHRGTKQFLTLLPDEGFQVSRLLKG